MSQKWHEKWLPWMTLVCALPKCASEDSELGMNTTLWEGIFTATFADTKYIIYKYLSTNHFFFLVNSSKDIIKKSDFSILENPEKKRSIGIVLIWKLIIFDIHAECYL